MLNLICGPSGSGKTAALTQAIRRDIEQNTRCYLLVPEQQAYISERDLPKKLPQNAGLFFEIVNFSGLCDDVFHEFGGVTQLSADHGTRSVLMWETLRSLSGVLGQYGRSARGDVGLTGSMLAAVEDLKNNGISSEQLEDAASKIPADAPLRQKLLDLAAIAAAFDARMEESFGGTISDKLVRLAKVLEKHRYFEGSHIYIDSFTSFTVPEYAVLTEIFRQADRVEIAFCTDAIRNASVQFAGVTETIGKVVKCAAMADSPVKYRLLSSEGNCRPDALRMLEHDLWRFDLRESDRVSLPDHGRDTVRLLTCNNLYEESEAAALNILDLVQNGLHFGDIAVVVRETETYRGVLDAAFERHGIPYFFSDRTELSAKPLSRLILSSMRAVSRNYRVQDVMTYVKTGLCSVDPRDAALFEEYCETWHITGSRFLDEVWNMNPDGLVAERSERAEEILEAANRVRAAVIKPLQTFSAELRESSRLTDRCRAVYRHLCRLGIPSLLSSIAGEELSLGQSREAGETVRLYRFVTESLMKLCDLLPDADVTLDEFFSLLTILFAESDLGSVPNVHDCVVIGSAATLRVEGVQASLLLGLCEGEFPKSVTDIGILTDGEKTALGEFGLRFDTDEHLRSSEELLYVYRAVTKPLRYLYLSLPLLNTDGTERSESLAFTRVRYLLDRRPDRFDLSAIRQSHAESTVKTPISDQKISPKEIGGSLYLSKTKINTFMRCPYSYYSNYTLRLRDKKDSSTSAADDGKFVHYIFQRFLEQMLGEDGRLRFPDSEELQTTVDGIVSEYLDRVCPIPPDQMDTRLLHLFSRLRALSVILLQSAMDEIAASGFQPRFFEEKIGKTNIPDLMLTLRDGKTVHLSGDIDRVDLYRKDDKVYVRVIDYKTGTADFRIRDVESGMDMQLLIYLYAATRIDPDHYIPAGAHYLTKKRDGGNLTATRKGFLLDDADLIALSDTSEGQIYTHPLKKLTAEEIAKLIETVKGNISTVAERILSGEATKTPSSDACKYCAVRESCDIAAPKSKF